MISVGPVVESLGGELGPVVDADLLRQGTAIDAYDRENARDIGTTEAAARHRGQALPGVEIDQGHASKGRAIRQAVVHDVHGPLLVESGRKLTQLPPQNRRWDLNYVSPNKQRSSVTFPCDFDHRAMPFEHARRSVTRALTMKKPFDELAEGLLSEKSRGDWTPLELFIAGVQRLEVVLRRKLENGKSR